MIALKQCCTLGRITKQQKGCLC